MATERRLLYQLQVSTQVRKRYKQKEPNNIGECTTWHVEWPETTSLAFIALPFHGASFNTGVLYINAIPNYEVNL